MNETMYIGDLSAGDQVEIETASGTLYRFVVLRDGTGQLSGGQWNPPVKAAFVGSCDALGRLLRKGELFVGGRARFLVGEQGEMVTSAVRKLGHSAQHAA